MEREAIERELKEKEKQKKKLVKYLDRVTSQCLEKQICTFVGTGNLASMQFVYFCITCKKDICEMCTRYGCHAGHDLFIRYTDLDEHRTQLKREAWCQCSQGGHECKRSQAEGMPAMKNPLSPRQQILQEQRAAEGGSDSDSSSLRSPRPASHEPEHVAEVKPVITPISARPANPNPSTRSFFTARSQQNLDNNTTSRPSREKFNSTGEQDSNSPSTQHFSGRADNVTLGRRAVVQNNTVDNDSKDQEDKEEQERLLKLGDDLTRQHKDSSSSTQGKTRRPLVSVGQSERK